MNKQELLKNIEQWAKAMEHQKIIDAINALPENERDYTLTCILAREYNVVQRFADAKALMESVRAEGQKDPNWFFHYGYTLYSLRRFAEAKGAFQQVLKMVPKHPNVLMLLNSCEANLEKEALAKAYGDGTDLDEDKTLEHILKCHLHNNFEAKDIVEEDHISIPSWNMRIYPELTELEKDSVIVTFNVECPDWDRDFVEISAAKGKNTAAALNVACTSFVMSAMNTIALMKKKANAVKLESDFAGKKHSWSVYRGNLLAGGEAQSINSFDYYWSMLKDELAKRLGNQKMAYVKVYVSKTGDNVRGEVRINDIRVESLSHKVRKAASEWQFSGYGVHRQFFILMQDEETLEPFPYDQETLEDFTRETVRLYNEVRSMEAAKALPGKLLELCGGDATLAKELQLYVPIAASEFFYKNLAYPETLTFDLDGQQAVVFRTQMASFYTIQKHLYWALQNKVFGKETQSIYHHLVSASPLFQFINKQEKEGHPVPDGMGMNLTISVDKDFQLR